MSGNVGRSATAAYGRFDRSRDWRATAVAGRARSRADGSPKLSRCGMAVKAPCHPMPIRRKMRALFPEAPMTLLKFTDVSLAFGTTPLLDKV